MEQILCVYYFITILQLSLSVPHNCINEPPVNYDESFIYVTSKSTTNDLDKTMYLKKFINEVSDTRQIEEIPEFCPGGVNGTLLAVKHIRNLIHFFVDDFIEIDNAKIPKNILYAGKPRIEIYCEDNSTSLDVCTKTDNSAILITESITDMRDVYNVIVKYSSDKPSDYSTEENTKQTTVLICSEFATWSEISNRFAERKSSLTYKLSDNGNCCETMEMLKNELVAILAAKPFPLAYELKIPIAFYDQPYISYEDMSVFENAVSIINEWKPLTHAFVKFLNMMKWNRVAMISDDAEYSEEFEAAMSQELANNGFAFHSYLCSQKDWSFGCDFDKMISSLVSANARIVIVNINERNGYNFFKSLNRHSVEHNVWLVRDWPFEGNYHFQNVYSISLGINNKHQKKDLNRIYAGIDNIIDSYETGGHASRNEFYRNLRSRTKSKQNALAFISKMNPVVLTVILKIDSDSKVTAIYGENYIDSHYDRIPCEIIKAENYFKPCGDQDFFLILLVVLIFLLVLLLIIYYGNEMSNTNSYSNL